MPHSEQAKKRLRQNEKQRVYNKSIRSEIKTLRKRFALSVEEKNVEAAGTLFRRVVSELDKAAKNHVYHRNNVARQKSKVAALFNTLKS